jgi:uncharacterized protein
VPDSVTLLIAAALGALVGLVMGLTGAGGTILAVPLLMWGLGWSLLQAAPVALLAVALGAAVGTLRGLRERLVRYRAATLIAVVGLMLAPLGLWLSARLPHATLIAAFALVLLWVALRNASSAWRAWRRTIVVPETEMLPALCPVSPDSGRFRWSGVTAGIMAGIGAVAGLLSGLLGVGGGFVVLPALLRVSNLSFASCVGTTLMVVALVSSGTVLMALWAGREFDWLAAVPFIAGTVAGLVVGQRLSMRLPLPLVQALFAVLVAAVAVAMGTGAVAGA